LARLRLVNDPPLETDKKKLNSHLCGSDYIKNTEPVKLGKDDEYPDWLWNLPLELISTEESVKNYDKDTWGYWVRVKRLEKRRIKKYHKMKFQTRQF
ncbi:hypothetical protein A3Q56_05192, partial [Intoshia linei]